MLAEAVIDDRISSSALVTGGAGIIGKAVCELLSKNGYLVAVADRDEVGARAVADACGGIALALDMTSEPSIGAMVVRALEVLDGRLDALAITPPSTDATLESDDVAAFQRSSAVHVLGMFLCIREAAKCMERGGRICTVAPAHGNRSGSAEAGSLHAAVTGAVLALTRHAAGELAGKGIAVNGVAPRLAASAPNVAEAVSWLLSPQAASVNGEILTVGGDAG
jgi:NAD(P)-dependent dehydrogenase (short-subunit alcohol dehydrogenase family)